MPRKSLKCIVELAVHAVTCPGVWLPFHDEVYLSCCLLGQRRRTRLAEPIFPFLFHDKLRFEKTYYTAIDPSQIADLLEDEHVLFELIQTSDTRSGGILLASFETDARDFLYPTPSYTPVYGAQDREVLMDRTIDFPGISPKIEFTTRTTIKETKTPHISSSGYSTDETMRIQTSPTRSRSRTRTRSPVLVEDFNESYQEPTIASISRSRSPSPQFRRKLEELSFSESSDSYKPVFIVRKKDDTLIGRVPGSPSLKPQKLRKKKRAKSASTTFARSRSMSPSRMKPSEYCPHCLYPHTDKSCTVCKLYKQYTGKKYGGHSYHFHPQPHGHTNTEVVREPRPVFESTQRDSFTEGLTDDDLEMTVPNYSMSPRSEYRPYSAPPPRYRPPSPLQYKSSLRAQFHEPSYLSRSERINRRVNEALARSGSRSPSPTPYRRSRSPSPVPQYTGYDSLDELATTFQAARERSMVHVNNGEFWTEKASEYKGKPHRHIFYDSMGKLYSKMYHRARDQVVDAASEDNMHLWELN